MPQEMDLYDAKKLTPFLRKDLLEILFQSISPMDYAALSMLLQYSREKGLEKLYLQDLAEHLRLPMDQLSNLAKHLQSKGYVQWTHDAKGEGGTYLILNQDALGPALTQKAYLSQFFQEVIQRFGQERFLTLVNEAAQLEEVMWQSAWKEDRDEPPQS